MYNVLREISTQFELRNQLVSCTSLPAEVELLKLALFVQNIRDLFCQDLVFFLLAIKVLGPLGGIVYDF